MNGNERQILMAITTTTAQVLSDRKKIGLPPKRPMIWLKSASSSATIQRQLTTATSDGTIQGSSSATRKTPRTRKVHLQQEREPEPQAVAADDVADREDRR